MKRYLLNILILLDCAVDSVLFGSSPFETMSSRLWRYRDLAIAAYWIFVIDWLFLHLFGQADHCENSEQARVFYEGYEILK